MTDFKVGDKVIVTAWTIDSCFKSGEDFQKKEGVIQEISITNPTSVILKGPGWSVNKSDLVLAIPNDIMYWEWKNEQG
jgi:hypothetical protein